MPKISLFIALLLSSLFIAKAQSINVNPYLQDATPTSIRIMWESSGGSESTVEWGLTTALGNTASGTSQTGFLLTQIHDTQITGLQPDTRYYYRVKTGSAQSSIYNFITPPLKNSEKAFNILLMSDMQQDSGNPSQYYEMCHDGVADYIIDLTGSSDIAAQIGCYMIPGDLVDNGLIYSQWENTFFDPCDNITPYTPLYPVLGNHEFNNNSYFKYFHLPENGTAGYEEHWWYKDYSNVRIIGLDSNTGYQIQAQLDWLQNVLNEAATDPDIDFVFAQLHHPHHSELWPAGNLDYTGQVITRLENFSNSTGKPSVHFYGHTHAYSRGNSQDHRHVMMNVATGGGNIDYWGEFAQIDYPEHLISQDDYGFVWAEIHAGTDPYFLLKRFSRGNQSQDRDNELRDSMRIERYNQAPTAPTCLFPEPNSTISPDCIVLFTASDYSDPDNDLHGATQWQLATNANFSNIVYDQWRQYKNEYNNTDTQVNDNLRNEPISALLPNTTYYWRVRYRDRNLVWSNWSEVATFQTTNSQLSANLLLNAGAENNTNNWTPVSGSFESIASGECAGNNAHSGARLFAVGGVCQDNAYGEGYQEIDLANYAAAIETGMATVKFGGYLSDYNGSDKPEFKLNFMDTANALISSTPTYSYKSGTWTYLNQTANIPNNTAKIRFVLMGTRESGSDNDSYFDDMFLQIDTLNCGVLYPTCAVAPNIGVLSGGNNVCAGATQSFTCATPIEGSIYNWTVVGGTIVSGQGTAQVTVQWANGNNGTLNLQQIKP
jgi:hypothetical protein